MSDDGMNSLQDLLDQHDYELPQVGDIRQGIVVATTPQGLIVDLGLKRDGIVPQSDLIKLEPDEREAIKINDEIFVYVVQTDDPEALIVSIHLARLNQDWIEAEELMQSGQVFEAEVVGFNKGGVIVPYRRIRGFVPISHLSEFSSGMNERRRQQRLSHMRGQMLAVKIIEVDRRRHRLVLSQKEAQKEWEEKKRHELLETLHVGDVRHGRVSGLRDFGAFVNIGGADGLVHISELSWHRVEHPREVVRVGDEIDVYVLGIDPDTQRISLSRKKLLPNPWDTVSQRYDVNELVEGKITRILEYGAFAEIEPGVEGLLHLSQLSRTPVENPRAVVQEGETHLLRIISIDQKRQRIGLSLKAVTANEQIEWMAQKEIAEAQRREEEAAAQEVKKAADEVLHHTPAVEAVQVAEETTAAAETAESITVVETIAEAVEVAAAEEAPIEETADEAAETIEPPGAVDEVVEEVETASAETTDVVEAVEEVEEVIESAVETAETVVEEPAERSQTLPASDGNAGIAEELVAPEATEEELQAE